MEFAAPGVPTADMLPSVLALSDVMGTGWFAAQAANVKPGATVVVVGDGDADSGTLIAWATRIE